MPSSLISEPVNRFWYGYLSKTEEARKLIEAEHSIGMHYDAAEAERWLLTLVRAAFQAGARWNLRETARLSPYITRFLEMCILLGPDPPRDAWLEMTVLTPQDGDDEWLVNVPF